MARHSNFAREKRAEEVAVRTMREGQYVAPNRTPTPFGQSKECVKPIRNRRNKYQAPRRYRLEVAERNTCAIVVREGKPYTHKVEHVWAQSPAARGTRWFLKSTDGYVGGRFNG